MKTIPFLYIVVQCNAILICLLGAIVIVGWYLDIPALIQIHKDFVPMQFNTALGFILASIGISLMLYQLPQSNFSKVPKISVISMICAIVLIMLGGLTLLQYIFNLNLGIDQFFFQHYITVKTSHPGRMAPNTALNFLLTGIAILLMNQDKIRNYLSYSSYLGALILGFSTVSLCGYIYHIETAYGWGKLTNMAVHTSIGFILVGLNLILEIQYLWQVKKQQLNPTFWAFNLMIFSLTITISLWQAVYATTLFDPTEANDIYLKNLVSNGILFFGTLLSVVLTIAVWLAHRFYEQVKDLKIAHQKILSLNRKLKKLSYIDGLTNIANRRFFNMTFEKEWSRTCRRQERLLLMIIDIDYFKNYNDFYGHQQGDECIKNVAHILKKLVNRKTDLVARYGGEEFILLMTDISPESAQMMAENIHKTIVNLRIPHAASPIHSSLTISLGYNIVIPTPDLDPTKFILEADKALYQAKQQGRNRVVGCRQED